MAVQIQQSTALPTEENLAKASHVLIVLAEKQKQSPVFDAVLQSKLKRNRMKLGELGKKPLSADLPSGGVASWLVLADTLSPFQRQTLLRKALQPILDEKPEALHILVDTADGVKAAAVRDAIYIALLNAEDMPGRKEKSKTYPLKRIHVHGWQQKDVYAEVQALAAGNTLTRKLTMEAPNSLTPARYRKQIAAFAKAWGCKHEEFDLSGLSKMGAGAFVAVGQGSDPQDAAIVHLSYQPKGAKKHIALVGKGICFDTGGHNLKSSRYMLNMHEDMNGSAVVLGILQAVSSLKLPVKLDCWQGSGRAGECIPV